jgi:hypothetical protein
MEQLRDGVGVSPGVAALNLSRGRVGIAGQFLPSLRRALFSTGNEILGFINYYF